MAQFSEERADRIVEALRLGASREGAAACAGIAPSTLYDWIRRGRAGEGPYSSLWNRVEVEQRAWEVEALRRVHKAAESGTWQAAAWLLERRLPRRYGRRMDDATVERLADRRVKELLAKAEREREEAADEEAMLAKFTAQMKSDPAYLARIRRACEEAAAPV